MDREEHEKQGNLVNAHLLSTVKGQESKMVIILILSDV